MGNRMSTPTVTSVPGQIRNIQQSVQQRDVTKQASDIVVYIDGADYLINPYLSEDGVTVSFNDYVTTWSATYDLDAMIPTCSLTLTVPVQDDHLFRYPGGNYLLNTMAEIRIFAKGYYLSPRGNTVYRQVFKGFIQSISYSQDGTMTTISLSCSGALAMLERMQIDQNPAAMSSSPLSAMPFTSTQWNLDPYQQIAFGFLYASMIDGFEQYSIEQMAMQGEYTDATGHPAGNPYFEAVQERYVAKWQALLFDLARDVHIFGAPNVLNVIAALKAKIKPPDASKTPHDKEAMGIWSDVVGTTTESDQAAEQEDFYAQLRGYMPDMGFSSIQLLNGRVTSRLERLRLLVSHIGFEAYQDVDGGIVIKPPLYNLDVCDIQNALDGQIDPALDYITDTTNPFVVQQSEILTEQETENEANVRLTRLTARGSLNPGMQVSGGKELLTVAEDIDIAKLAQFGLRTEPPREANWFRNGDEKAVYAYAASELARANRGFRYYTITIPMRPELKLGFPMYIPHKDMYGYIKSVTMTWTRGSNATTAVVLDSLRCRPLFPVEQDVPQAGAPPKKTRLMTQQPNLVLQWTKVAENPSAKKGDTQAQRTLSQLTDQGKVSAYLAGKIATLPLPQQLVVDQQLQMMDSRRLSGLEYTLNSDSATHNWRIQEDNKVKGVFSSQRTLDSTYYESLRTIRPYTDHKGYEVVGPFPWGRWKSLKECLNTFTISNSLYGGLDNNNPAITPTDPGTTTVTDTNAFLFTGDSVPASHLSASDMLMTLVPLRGNVGNYKSFELEYLSETTSPSLASTLGASTELGTMVTESPGYKENVVAATMLSGKATSTSLFERILNSVRNHFAS